jgi:predicted Zn-dependent peptidase
MEYKKFKLKNGLTTVMSPLRETQAVTILILLPVGSRYETKAINGVSHFIEHLMFKGTQKRPSTLDIVKELDQVGAVFNAFTGKEYTGYYIKIDAKKLELGLDLLSDMLFQSTFQAAEIDRERGVIIEEIKMYEDNPLMYIEDLFEQTIFDGHKLGWEIAGSPEIIRQISRSQIMNFYKKYYQPENMILTLAGKFDQAQAKTLINKYFGKQKNNFSKNSAEFTRINPESLNSLKIKFKKQVSEQVQLALGFPAYKYGDLRSYAVKLLSVILGGNMSSRLFINIRERNGLAYFVRSSVDAHRDIGLFLIRAGVSQKNLIQATSLIMAELAKIKDELVNPEELRKAKDYLRGKMILSLEDSESIAEWCGDQQLYASKIMTPQEKIAKFEAVTALDIQSVAQDIFDKNKISLAMIGQNKIDLKKVLQ